MAPAKWWTLELDEHQADELEERRRPTSDEGAEERRPLRRGASASVGGALGATLRSDCPRPVVA
jgi:hypothetical protein